MRVRNKKWLISLVLVFCVTVSLFVGLRFASALNGITVYVSPSEINTIAWEYFEVYIYIDNPLEVDIYDYDIFLGYNSTQMTAIGAIDGGYLKSDVTFNWENLVGGIHIWAATSDGGQNALAGTLTIITFRCSAPGVSPLNLQAVLSDSVGDPILPDTIVGGSVVQTAYWEPLKLQHLVELPYAYHMIDLPFVPPSSAEGYEDVKAELEAKGYVFDAAIGGGLYHIDSFFDVYFEPGSEPFDGTVVSWWSSNLLEDGTRACLLSAEMSDGSSMAMGFVTNLLPPDQIPEVDPYIIYNAEPYFFIDFYWWAWTPVGKVVHFYYWWHDSHNHPNWFWGPYWWWRTCVKSYYYPYTVVPYWRPWWGWWWHWVYWRHWYWWSTYFPYDP